MNFADELPDIPYTPMRDSSIDEGAATSSATDPPDPKRSRPMTPAERKARSRQAQSAMKREEAREKNRQGNVKMRVQQSIVQKEEAREKDQQGKVKIHSQQLTVEKEEAREKNRQGNVKMRSQQSEDQR